MRRLQGTLAQQATSSTLHQAERPLPRVFLPCSLATPALSSRAITTVYVILLCCSIWLSHLLSFELLRQYKAGSPPHILVSQLEHTKDTWETTTHARTDIPRIPTDASRHDLIHADTAMTGTVVTPARWAIAQIPSPILHILPRPATCNPLSTNHNKWYRPSSLRSSVRQLHEPYPMTSLSYRVMQGI